MTPIDLLARIIAINWMLAHDIRSVYPAIPRPTGRPRVADQRAMTRKIAPPAGHDWEAETRAHRGELIRGRR